jgi:murein DD-endopeptidase MepM/ murein hydrolase activator NlpD
MNKGVSFLISCFNPYKTSRSAENSFSRGSIRKGLKVVPQRLILIIFILSLLLSGCAETAEECPRPALVDVSQADSYINDESLPFQFPLEEFSIYRYGPYTNYVSFGTGLDPDGKYHAAEDLDQPPGTPVYAMADGEIAFSGRAGGYGWLIIINHPQANLYSLYGHLSPSRWHIQSGADINKGELIAYIGDTYENGSDAKYGEMPPHLHFGVRAGQMRQYPGTGEWRWQAGWIKPCPQDLGWLQPSVIITNQQIPDGGFTRPPSGLLEKWGGELLFSAFILVGAVSFLIFALKKQKPVFMVFYGCFIIAFGWLYLLKDGMWSGNLVVCLGAFTLVWGGYRFLRDLARMRRDNAL